MNLIGTDVLIDCLRGTPSATAWLKQLANQSFAVPGVVAMELVMGCTDGKDLQKVQKFLNAFQIVWPEASDFGLAYQLLVNHRLSSGGGNFFGHTKGEVEPEGGGVPPTGGLRFCFGFGFCDF